VVGVALTKKFLALRFVEWVVYWCWYWYVLFWVDSLMLQC
jgi:hypothetical protein